MQEIHTCRINTNMPDRRPPRSARSEHVIFNIETERETDGRWIAEIVDIPGVLAYGANEKAAKVARRIIADRAKLSLDGLI